MAHIQAETPPELFEGSNQHSYEEEKNNSIDHSVSLDGKLDTFNDGIEYPTEEEHASLRRVVDIIPSNVYLFTVVVLVKRFAFLGSSVVFINFAQQPLPDNSHTGAGGLYGQSGALGLGQHRAIGLTTFYQFWCYVTPLLGAYIADTHIGRFNTICIAIPVVLLGYIVLIIAAVPGVIEHKGATGAFAVALIVMGFGTGLFMSDILPLIAEQYKKTKLFVVTTSSGERVIVDPNITISRIYTYSYYLTNVGALAGQISMTYSEQFVGFYLAYTLPTVIFLLCPIILLIGRKRYVRSPPTGSVLGTALRLWMLAARGRWSWNPVKAYKNLTAPDFWENVKPSKQRGEMKPNWMTFDEMWVDEVKRGLKACAVFLWSPLYWFTYDQLNSNLTSQALTMSAHGLPTVVLINLEMFTLIIFVPICDIIIYPALRRRGIRFGALRKITMGFIFGASAMLWAAVVQYNIDKTNPCLHSSKQCRGANINLQISPLSVWTQTGSYVLLALSNIFTSISGLEYAFTKAPTNMRSLVMAFFLFTPAISSALGEIFDSSSNPWPVKNYTIMAVIAGIAGVPFWLSVRSLDAQEDAFNNAISDQLVNQQ